MTSALRGEGGGWPISDQRKGGCVDLLLTRGREGVKFSRRHMSIESAQDEELIGRLSQDPKVIEAITSNEDLVAQLSSNPDSE